MLSCHNGEIVTERTSKIPLLTKPAVVLESVYCDIPQLEEEYIEEYVSLPVSLFGEGEFYILRANGDSMIGAGINTFSFKLVSFIQKLLCNLLNQLQLFLWQLLQFLYQCPDFSRLFYFIIKELRRGDFQIIADTEKSLHRRQRFTILNPIDVAWVLS